MKRKPLWFAGALGIVAAIAVPLYIFWPRASALAGDPWAAMPVRPIHTEHTDIVAGPFETPQEVTLACLKCHPDSAAELMHTTHWTWESEPVQVPWRDEPVTIGKKNQINNFCIGIQGNWRTCTSCHAGYGWANADFDFSDASRVDCLACHADPSTYAKGDFGYPADGVDLLEAARSVRATTRDNCGTCHFDGGGGNNVKHGDLDESLYFPSAGLDIHMGEHDFLCTDCHRTEAHEIRGRLFSDNYTIDPAEQVACTDCHEPAGLHDDDRITLHLESVACQTCHVPAIALRNPTKTSWDWSTVGEDRPDDHYTYLKIKGSFVYEDRVEPSYLWSNGNVAYRYLLGDPIDPTQPTLMNPPAGSIEDATAKIFPFKVHVANQPFDVQYKHLLQPVTSGEGGLWTTYDWQSAFALSEEFTGLAFSGEFDFAETVMHWPSTHMVQPGEKALQCDDCHSAGGRMDWEALGYPGDPVKWGGRFSTNLVARQPGPLSAADQGENAP